MSANESFLAAMGTFVAWVAGLYGMMLLFERWEAKERAGPKQKP
jgi:hypothetical protein